MVSQAVAVWRLILQRPQEDKKNIAQEDIWNEEDFSGCLFPIVPKT